MHTIFVQPRKNNSTAMVEHEQGIFEWHLFYDKTKIIFKRF